MNLGVGTSLAVGLCSAMALADVQVFYSDFDSGAPAELSGFYIIESVQGLAGAGNLGDTFEGMLLRNNATGNPAAATRLTLTDLLDHTYISIGFLFAYIDSWDGPSPPHGPDYFNIAVDGVPVFQIATDYGPQIYSGHAGWQDWVERGIDLTADPSLMHIAHSATTLTITFWSSGEGWQGGEDESWGIDNLRISGDFVPAPGAMALLLMGGAGLCRRRR